MVIIPGVYIDGGQCTIREGNLRVIALAEDIGRESMVGKWSMLDALEDDVLSEYADDAIIWLNDHRSDGGSWYWECGDFGYWAADDEENEDY